MHTIALIADTHGVLAPLVCPLLAAAKVTHILHAGDVGPGKKGAERNRLDARSLLAALSDVSHVDAVRGNTDDNHHGHNLPATLVYQAGAVRFVVHHGDNNGPHSPAWQDDDAVLAALQPEGGWRTTGDVIVSGHSHDPRFVRHASGFIFLNPGTAGGPTETSRFTTRFPQQLAIVRCSGTTLDVSAINLRTEEVRAWVQDEPSPFPNERKRKKATGMATLTASGKRPRQPAAASGGAGPPQASSSAAAAADPNPSSTAQCASRNCDRCWLMWDVCRHHGFCEACDTYRRVLVHAIDAWWH